MDGDQKAWLMLCAGDDREHGGNDGYADLPESSYLWDSTVGNASKVRAGDWIVLWDKEILLGVSVIERIEVDEETKTTYKCPRCRRAHIKARRTKTPRYKCYDAECQELFEDPVVVQRQVVTYRSLHGSGWVDLRGRLRGPQLRELCFEPKSQGSLRLLQWEDFRRAAEDGLPDAAWRPLDHTIARIAGGHQQRTVRVRIGQAQFRQRLLEQVQEPVCAFTGPAPVTVLEAGHLYSYAVEGVHHQDGGMLMRRDVHILFDRGHLAIAPSTWTIDVSPQIRGYSAYGPLHGQPLHVPLMPRHKKWLALHWAQYRGEMTRVR